MRVTQHSGRTHRNGQSYSTKHNDRNFSTSADNIDREKTPDNRTWTWCSDSKNEELKNLSFDDAELLFYTQHYQKQLDSTNEKYIKARHKERVVSMDAWRKQKKHAPEEVILQLGKLGNTTDFETFRDCFKEYVEELEKWNLSHGDSMKILDWALHQDELGAPHAHLRRVWEYYNTDSKQFELGQEKALALAGVPLPCPDKPVGHKNNRKMTFDSRMRTLWQNIAKGHGLEIETQPLPKNEVGMSLDQKIRMNEEERKNKLREADIILDQAKKEKSEMDLQMKDFTCQLKEKIEDLEQKQSELIKMNEQIDNKIEEKADMLLNLDKREKDIKSSFEKLESEKEAFSEEKKKAEKLLQREENIQEQEKYNKHRENLLIEKERNLNIKKMELIQKEKEIQKQMEALEEKTELQKQKENALDEREEELNKAVKEYNKNYQDAENHFVMLQEQNDENQKAIEKFNQEYDEKARKIAEWELSAKAVEKINPEQWIEGLWNKAQVHKDRRRFFREVADGVKGFIAGIKKSYEKILHGTRKITENARGETVCSYSYGTQDYTEMLLNTPVEELQKAINECKSKNKRTFNEMTDEEGLSFFEKHFEHARKLKREIQRSIERSRGMSR